MSTPATAGVQRLAFDGRPRGLLLLARGWRLLALVLVIAGTWTSLHVSAHLPHSGGSGVLTAPALRAITIFAAAVALWITQPVPLVVTGFGVFVALCLGDIAPLPAHAGAVTALAEPTRAVAEQTRVVAGWFADPIVFFLLGAFLIAGSLSSAHVVDHVALRLLSLLGTSARRLRQVLYWIAFLTAFFMSEHAVVAMLFPLASRIRDALARPVGSTRYVPGLFMGLAWGATIGGIVTYLGGSRNPLAMGFLARQEVAIPGFFELMAYSLPVAVPLALIASVLLEYAFPVDIASVAPARDALAERRRELGRFGARQRTVSLILVAAVVVWTIAGYEHIAVVALSAAGLLLGLRLVSWRDLAREVPWDLLLLYASALALAKALTSTGAPALIAAHLLPVLPHEPLVVVLVIATIAMLLTEAVSHGAVVSMLVPLLIGAAPSLHMDPVILALAVALPTGLAFMLPMGSPPLAIAFASGEFRLGTMTRYGAILNFLAVPVVGLAYVLAWRHLR